MLDYIYFNKTECEQRVKHHIFLKNKMYYFLNELKDKNSVGRIEKVKNTDRNYHFLVFESDGFYVNTGRDVRYVTFQLTIYFDPKRNGAVLAITLDLDFNNSNVVRLFTL